MTHFNILDNESHLFLRESLCRREEELRAMKDPLVLDEADGRDPVGLGKHSQLWGLAHESCYTYPFTGLKKKVITKRSGVSPRFGPWGFGAERTSDWQGQWSFETCRRWDGCSTWETIATLEIEIQQLNAAWPIALRSMYPSRQQKNLLQQTRPQDDKSQHAILLSSVQHLEHSILGMHIRSSCHPLQEEKSTLSSQTLPRRCRLVCRCD